MKLIKFLLIFLSFFATIPIVAIAQTNGNPKNHPVILQPLDLPKPHIIEVGDPVAMYDSSLDMLYIDLDPVLPFLIQNCTLSNSQYVIANDYTAGRSVDAGRTAGDVVVESGVEYEIEYNGIVRLDRGFRVEKGARFSAFQRKF